jgi:hypothetical protein
MAQKKNPNNRAMRTQQVIMAVIGVIVILSMVISMIAR